jgi:hypothetical protein
MTEKGASARKDQLVHLRSTSRELGYLDDGTLERREEISSDGERGIEGELSLIRTFPPIPFDDLDSSGLESHGLISHLDVLDRSRSQA